MATDQSLGAVPPYTTGLMITLSTIFASTPKRVQWEHLEDHTICIPLIMNLRSWEEMHHAAIFVHKFSVTQLADAQKGYNAYGPIPRLCIEFTLFPTLLSSYDTSRQATISDLSVDELVEGAIQTSVLRSDAFHSIFVIRRQDDDMLMKFTVEPITHSIRQQLKKRFIQEGWEGQYRAYQHFDVMRLSDFADLVFEVMAQLRFRGAIALSPVPVVKQRRTRRTKTALWVSRSGKRLASPISITSSSTIEYEWSTLSEFHSGIFYVPKLSD